MEEETKIEFGRRYADSVTGFTGVATGRATYMHHEPAVLLESIDTTGRPIEEWVKEKRLTSADTGA